MRLTLQEFMPRVLKAIEHCSEIGFEYAPRIWIEHGLKELPINQWGPMVFSAPVLHESECDELLAAAGHHYADFTPNAQEGKDYQIPELILQDHCKRLYDQCSFIAHHRLTPLFQMMMGHTPTLASSIQLARYDPENTAQTGWHVDEESELTCVISLCPERHEGGGTYLRPYGPAGRTVFVPPLQKGHGLFFNGRFVHHRGAKVISGERMLLVYWLMGGSKDENSAE